MPVQVVTPPNQAFVELPPVIMRRNVPAQLMRPTVEEVRDKSNDIPIPAQLKGKQRENPADPGPSTSKGKQKENPAGPSTSQIPNKEPPKFGIKDLKDRPENQKFQPQYKYGLDLMNLDRKSVV